MHICPKCQTEYEKEIERCADCGTILEEISLIECNNCNETINEDELFCEHCGFRQDDGDEFIECENHSEENSIGVCIICEKPLCGNCAKEHDNKLFCQDDYKITVVEDYAIVHTCYIEYEAAMIKSNIEMAGIDCQIFSQKDSMLGTNYGNLSVIKIMVKKNDFKTAQEIINSLDSIEIEENPEDE